ncbi:MAG: SAM-dependent methyltransferase, partial [Candidatus Dormibacteraceae bacterium]
VLLAAGLDTRAYRLQWNAGTTVYELDAPKVLEFKDRVLADQGARPQCRRQIVGCDLREDWCSALQQMGFDSSRPTAWLAEGLLPFLSDEAQDNLFTQVHQLSVTNSQIAAECLSVNLAALSRQPIFENMAQEFGIDIPESQPDGRRYDPEAGLVNRGWTASTSPASSVAENYHRPLDGTIPLLELFRSNLLLTANL